jgi:hypothetical protein
MSKLNYTRYASKNILELPDVSFNDLCFKTAPVFYGTNSRKNTMAQVLELRECVRQDYPDIKDEDIEVLSITSKVSERFAGYTMVRIDMPLDDFVKLRDSKDIYNL